MSSTSNSQGHMLKTFVIGTTTCVLKMASHYTIKTHDTHMLNKLTHPCKPNILLTKGLPQILPKKMVFLALKEEKSVKRLTNGKPNNWIKWRPSRSLS